MNHYNLKGKRILVSPGSFCMGGAERQAVLLAHYLQQRCEADVQVWAFSEPDVGSRECDRLGLLWRSLPWPMRYGWWQQKAQNKLLEGFTRELQAEKFNAIVPFGISLSVLYGLIWRAAGTRFCAWNQRCSGEGFKHFDLPSRRQQCAVIEGALHLIANSTAGAEMLCERFHLARPVQVIHNGVTLAPPQKGRAQWRSELDLADDTPAFCMVANFQLWKDHFTLLRAWALAQEQWRARGQKRMLLLAGRSNPQITEPLRQLIEEAAISSSVRFLGEVEDVSGLLGAADIGVFSSRSEGVPNGLLETMAAGLAVAATDIPGNREVLGEGYEFYAPPKDAQILAEHMIRLADDETLRERTGERNAQRVQTEFSPERMGNAYAELIAQAVA